MTLNLNKLNNNKVQMANQNYDIIIIHKDTHLNYKVKNKH